MPNTTKSNDFSRPIFANALPTHECQRGDGEWIVGLGRTRKSHHRGAPVAVYIAPTKINPDQRQTLENHITGPPSQAFSYDALNRAMPSNVAHHRSYNRPRLSPGDLNPIKEGRCQHTSTMPPRRETIPIGAIIATFD